MVKQTLFVDVNVEYDICLIWHMHTLFVNIEYHNVYLTNHALLW